MRTNFLPLPNLLSNHANTRLVVGLLRNRVLSGRRGLQGSKIQSIDELHLLSTIFDNQLQKLNLGDPLMLMMSLCPMFVMFPCLFMLLTVGHS